MNERLRLTLLLMALGAGWGMTQPLTKITVSGGYQPLGLVFWQLAIGAVVLGALLWRRLGRIPVVPSALMVWLFIAVMGTVLPNSASFRAAATLPSGIMSIVIASVPMFAFPIALVLGVDRFSAPRLAGLLLGLGGVALIALPQAALPDRAMVAVLPLALVAPFCYAVEANGVARWGTAGLDPVQVLFGASVTGALIAGPLAWATGQFFVPHPPFVLQDATLLAAALINIVVYTTYVWLVGRAGATFAGQVAYLVTGFGVLWAMLLLGERYSLWVWAALALMAAGLTLVRPRDPVAPAVANGESGTPST
ncbi:EamA-like transporter family protein [Loktanella atrilutea]|uniref:EamA-like transporter family protein n=1 Tax=Loktanella atrilutea TaxID=366533 RepID=A0A1M5BL19_LOKAT|nr:DMT family transporter [Loktanella atrilutea]SHF43254.1 EamA-like transporter family protein [Loktanella atrilutea]